MNLQNIDNINAVNVTEQCIILYLIYATESSESIIWNLLRNKQI